MGKPEKQKQFGMDLTEGPILSSLTRFSIPFLLASIIQTLYSAVDLSVMGHVVGNSGTVAVSMGGKVTLIATMVGMAFSSAGQIYVGQLVGAKDEDGLNKCIGNLFSLLLATSVVCSAVAMLLDGWIVTVLNTPAEAVKEAYNYIFVCAFGFPFLFLYNGACSVLRGMGDSKNPLIYVTIASVVNLVLDIFFVRFLRMGAAGAALATALSQALSAIFAMVHLYLHKDRFGFGFQLSSFKPAKVHVHRLAKLGIPLTARQLLINISSLIVTGYVNDFGITEAAAYGVAEKLYQMLNTIDQSFNTAGAAMISQNIGAKKHDRVKSTMRALILLGLAVAAVIAVLVIVFPRQLFALFTTDEGVLDYAPAFGYVIAFGAVLTSFNGAFKGIVDGSGRGGLSLLGGVLDSIVVRFSLCWLFGYVLNLGVVGIYMGSNFAKIAPILVGLIFYLSGNWKKKNMLTEENAKAKGQT